VNTKFVYGMDQMWERACSRKRCVRRRLYQLDGRLREQARSHSGSSM